MPDIGFAPTVRCPHCNHVLRPQMTGWARTGLNVRDKGCFKCGKEFKLVAYVETAKEGISDGELRGLKDRVKYETEKRQNFVRGLEEQLEYQRLKYIELIEKRLEEERAKTVELIAAQITAPGLN